jgi:hypothetical protein
MRHLTWLSGLLLVISCSVDPVQNADGSGTGGGGGQAGRPTGGTTGSGGQAGDHPGGGTAGGGGTTGGGGTAGAGGTAGNGGTTGGGGTAGTGGTAGIGGTAGTGGSSTAGHDGGGQGGHGTDGGGESCAQLETDYGNALGTARQCTPGSVNPCQHLVEMSLSCSGCKEYVNDVTTLNALTAEWQAQDCQAIPHVCPAIACINPGPGSCTTSGGPGQCQSGTPVPAS